MQTSTLQRFLDAQANGEYERALAEITSGRKRGHWIWYVFPQLAGLGLSQMSQTYGIQGRAEAEAYLRHPVLAARLLEIARAAAVHLQSGVAVETLTGSSIDAAKLVSSMTLFSDAARGLPASARTETTVGVEDAAAAILTAAAPQGYPRCAFTTAQLGP